MFCHKIWDTAFLISNFTPFFINGKLKRRRQDLLLAAQRAMLPSTHGALTAEREKRKMKEDIVTRKVVMKQAKEAYEAAAREVNCLQARAAGVGGYFVRAQQKSSCFKCPEDGCRGFLHEHKCNVCLIDVCGRCMVKKQIGHECDDATVETVKTLRKDTKPCPGAGCKALITKLFGCDQMWCTSCHTTFSWITGLELSKGVVHNPHYVDFIRNNGTLKLEIAAPLDECNALPSVEQYTRMFHMLKAHKPRMINQTYTTLENIVRHFNHNAYVEMPRFSAVDISPWETEMRVKYMLKEISEEHWKSQLHRVTKDADKNKEFFMVIDMVNATGSGILLNLLHDLLRSMNFVPDVGVFFTNRAETALEQLEKIRNYANDELAKIGVAFQNRYPKYAKNFEFIRKVDDVGNNRAKSKASM